MNSGLTRSKKITGGISMKKSVVPADTQETRSLPSKSVGGKDDGSKTRTRWEDSVRSSEYSKRKALTDRKSFLLDPAQGGDVCGRNYKENIIEKTSQEPKNVPATVPSKKRCLDGKETPAYPERVNPKSTTKKKKNPPPPPNPPPPTPRNDSLGVGKSVIIALKQTAAPSDGREKIKFRN